MIEPCLQALELLKAGVGRELTPSPWLRVDQQRIDRFADATLDRQFIHVDPAAAARSPFGGAVAHGFLTLSLIPHLAEGMPPVGAAVTVNYGLNRVRFPAPLRSGARVRLRRTLLAVEARGSDALLLTHRDTVEVEGQEKPGCVAETLMLLRWGAGPPVPPPNPRGAPGNGSPR